MSGTIHLEDPLDADVAACGRKTAADESLTDFPPEATCADCAAAFSFGAEKTPVEEEPTEPFDGRRAQRAAAADVDAFDALRTLVDVFGYTRDDLVAVVDGVWGRRGEGSDVR